MGSGQGARPWVSKSRGPDGTCLYPCCCAAVALSKPSPRVQPDTLSWSTGGSPQLRSENPQGFPRIKKNFLTSFCGLAPARFLNISCLLHGLSSQSATRMCPTLRHPRALACIVPLLGKPSRSPPHRHPVPNTSQPSRPACLPHDSLTHPDSLTSFSPWLREHLICAASSVLRTLPCITAVCGFVSYAQLLWKVCGDGSRASQSPPSPSSTWHGAYTPSESAA